MPVDILLLRDRGLSFGEIGIVVAAGTGAMLVAQIPSGYLADRIGRRRTLMLSAGLMTLGALLFGIVGTFAAFIAAQATFTLGIAFKAGVSDAWLYDTLADQGREDEFAHVSGRARFALLVVLGLTSIAGGYLGTIDYGIAYLATALFTACGLLIAFSLPEPGKAKEEDTLRVSDAIALIRKDFLRPSIRQVVLSLGLFFGAITALNAIYIQPASVAVGVPEAHLGWFFALLTGVGAIASYYAGAIEKRVSTEQWLFFVTGGLGVVFVTALIVPVFILAGFVLARAVHRITQSIAGQYINDRVGTAGRATVLSTVAMVYSVFSIPIRIGAGQMGNTIPPETAGALVGGLVLLPTLYIGSWILKRRWSSQSEKPTEFVPEGE
ncbi:major facilitator superfamily MFS_1 [Natrialba chahannaoensis JCM 10990]|uniref:Major facilitator superfamily MFS_1 n=2 Tax=Natrialba chahannaoensis TaxID=68911 RepID=M0ABJ8_9EURY|nr:major facilitator superfamily MFS_1 [Natrialba chahannaoensis JCM 10990]